MHHEKLLGIKIWYIPRKNLITLLTLIEHNEHSLLKLPIHNSFHFFYIDFIILCWDSLTFFYSIYKKFLERTFFWFFNWESSHRAHNHFSTWNFLFIKYLNFSLETSMKCHNSVAKLAKSSSYFYVLLPWESEAISPKSRLPACLYCLFSST